MSPEFLGLPIKQVLLLIYKVISPLGQINNINIKEQCLRNPIYILLFSIF